MMYSVLLEECLLIGRSEWSQQVRVVDARDGIADAVLGAVTSRFCRLREICYRCGLPRDLTLAVLGSMVRNGLLILHKTKQRWANRLGRKAKEFK